MLLNVSVFFDGEERGQLKQRTSQQAAFEICHKLTE